MQTAETFTFKSLLKLLLLFVLLITGVVLKTSDSTAIVDARNMKASPSALETDSSQLSQRYYFQLARPVSSSAAL